jgi:hypothetical protein
VGVAAAGTGAFPPELYRDIQLHGVMLRSRLLRFTHIVCCVNLSQFVQQFLTRLVIAHPGRSNSQCVARRFLSLLRYHLSESLGRGQK